MSRAGLAGARVAVAGLGVSGLACAEALLAEGAKVWALDQRPAPDGRQLDAIEKLQALGAEVVTGWHGRLEPSEFDLLVVSPGFPRSHPVLEDMAGKTWGEIELAGRLARGPILALTGTNGKSTTTVLAWLLLQAEGAATVLCGNISGSGFPEQPLTRAALTAEPEDILVAEVSSFQLENSLTFHPRSAGITNITPDHLDRHPTFEDYRDTKLKLFQSMGTGDRIVFNVNALLPSREMIPLGPELMTVGGESGDLSYDDEYVVLGSQKVARSSFVQRSSFFFENLVMAWGLASAFAALGSAALKAAQEFRGLAHRTELIGERNGVKVYNNSMCTNPAAAAASIRGLGVRQHVLLGGKTKGMTREDYSVLRETLAEGHQGYIHGPHAEDLNEWLGARNLVHCSMLEGFQAAAEAAQPGEAIHLAPGCASAEPYAHFRERGEAFRQAAQEWLSHGG